MMGVCNALKQYENCLKSFIIFLHVKVIVKELLDLVMIKHEVKEICEKAKKVIDIYGL